MSEKNEKTQILSLQDDIIFRNMFYLLFFKAVGWSWSMVSIALHSRSDYTNGELPRSQTIS